MVLPQLFFWEIVIFCIYCSYLKPCVPLFVHTWNHACPLEGGVPQKVMWPRAQTSSLPWIPNHVTLNILCQKSPHYGWFYLVLKFFSYHDRKVDFCQDALFKNRLFHVFQLFPIVSLTLKKEKLKCMIKMIFEN